MADREVDGYVFPVVISAKADQAHRLQIIDEDGVDICSLYCVQSFNCDTDEALVYDRVKKDNGFMVISKKPRVIKVSNAKLKFQDEKSRL